MFETIHLLNQDVPDESEQWRWKPQPYLRMADRQVKGPVIFRWNKRQMHDLESLWLGRDADGARERLAADLGSLMDGLGWRPDEAALQDAEERGEEYLVTLSAAAKELYILPWEVLEVGASGTYLADFSCVLTRYCVPGLAVREPLGAPPNPGVLFAWSAAGGAVPHREQGQAIAAAAEQAGACFRELAEVGEASLQAALADDPPSVLHLLCHGLPGPEGEPPRLSWGTTESPAEVTATRLSRMLRPHQRALRLVVLSACGSGDSQGDALFMSSLAQDLHKKGIANVVASRYPLSVRGSKVLVEALYDQMLGQAWSLERALRHARARLFQVDASGHSHAGDAYGIQLYAHDREKLLVDGEALAERPVLASYPFGTAAAPTPASSPPRKAVKLTLSGGKAQIDAAVERVLSALRNQAEDTSLTSQVRRRLASKGAALVVETSVDGAQRLLSSWRAGDLASSLGFGVTSVVVDKAILAPLPSSGDQAATNAASAQAAGAQAAGLAGKALAAKLLVAAIAGGVAIAGATVALRSAGEPDVAAGAAQTAGAGAAGSDAGMPDAAVFDAGMPDAAVPDAAVPDAAVPDAMPDARARPVRPRRTRPSRPARPTVPDAEPKTASVPPVRVRSQALYDSAGGAVRVLWTSPAGAAGVLVVKSNAGPVRGSPRAGQRYTPGAAWPHGTGAVVSVVGKESAHDWDLPSGQSIWLALWAFDGDHDYSRVEPFKFTAP